MNFQIIENLQTNDDLDELKEAVEGIVEHNYQLSNYQLSMKPELQELLREGLKEADKPPIEWLKELLKKLEEVPVMKLTVAVDLPPTSIERMSRMVKQRLGPEVVLDIDVDRALVGGAVVEFKGKYHDGSLKKRLQEYFQKTQNGSENSENDVQKTQNTQNARDSDKSVRQLADQKVGNSDTLGLRCSDASDSPTCLPARQGFPSVPKL